MNLSLGAQKCGGKVALPKKTPKNLDIKLGSLMSPECASGCMERLCVLRGADNWFSSIFFFYHLREA